MTQRRPAQQHDLDVHVHLQAVRLRQLRLRRVDELHHLRRSSRWSPRSSSGCCARTPEADHDPYPHAPRTLVALRHAHRRPRRRRRAVRLDGPRQLQERGRAAPVAADLVAAAPRRWTTTRSCSPSSTSHLLHQLGRRRGRRHGRQPALLLDARLRPGEAGVPGQEGRLRRRHGAR